MIKRVASKDVNRICAQQVIQNLGIAVKELVENAVDAGATRVTVNLTHYGGKSIEVSDNGQGIAEGNFETLVARHHTSKLEEYNDLLSIASFGFRGEALHSLCNISSNVTVITRTKETPIGHSLKYDSDCKVIDKKTIAKQVGTTIKIDEVFASLPVRRNDFLKGIKNQFNNMMQLMQAYALVLKNVRILIRNQTSASQPFKTVLQTNGNEKMARNIIDLFGFKVLQSLEEINFPLELSSEYESGDWKIEGFVSKANDSGIGRKSSNRQFIFLNNRPVDMNKITRFMNQLWRQRDMKSKPMFILNFILPPGSFDVNVTPDKRDVFLIPQKEIMNALGEIKTIWEKSRGTMAVRPITEFYDASTKDQLSPEQVKESSDNSNINEKDANVGRAAGADIMPRIDMNRNIKEEIKEEPSSSAFRSRFKSRFLGGMNRNSRNSSTNENRQNDSFGQVKQEIKEIKAEVLTTTPSKPQSRFLNRFLNRSVKTAQVPSRKRPRLYSEDESEFNLDLNQQLPHSHSQEISQIHSYSQPEKAISLESRNEVEMEMGIVSDEDESLDEVHSINNMNEMVDNNSGSNLNGNNGSLRQMNDNCFNGDNSIGNSISSISQIDSNAMSSGNSLRNSAPLNQMDDNISSTAANTNNHFICECSCNNKHNDASGIISDEDDDEDSEIEILGDEEVQSSKPSATIIDILQSESEGESDNNNDDDENKFTDNSNKNNTSTFASDSAGRGYQLEFKTKQQEKDEEEKKEKESIIQTHNVIQSSNNHMNQVSMHIPGSAISASGSGSYRLVFENQKPAKPHIIGDDDRMYGDENEETTEMRAENSNKPKYQLIFDNNDSKSRTMKSDIKDDNKDSSLMNRNESDGPVPTAPRGGLSWPTLKMSLSPETLQRRIRRRKRIISKQYDRLEKIATGNLRTGSHYERGSVSVTVNNDNDNESTSETSKSSLPESTDAESLLSRKLTKQSFLGMRILGQFNRGFIVTKLGRDLYIIDQHASDEKYRFEKLQRTTVLQQQPLLGDLPLGLNSAQEMIIMEHLNVFSRNGFKFDIDEERMPGKRLRLKNIPYSKSTQFGVQDLHELVCLVSEAHDEELETLRSPKVMAMFASRSCRSAVMIGHALSDNKMKQIVRHMGTMDQPWNCPHGRPTLRHLVDIQALIDIQPNITPSLADGHRL